ncbi:hypothetical protein EQM14_04105 [Caproiciproducens sp. NJN-50]|uniref:CFI-box-CTERM domain-containing protein n=1 Tax=Caproiciproducens sp. NJN-50 TaxID=2507162 RepID=UPI000FFE138F|nr:CFI-box-CTERM domain-containing protein [Caproiciproducens sp. NJN-50]QAT49021.1 hypothetical protein EQM14_04105 [Caproiciproducens sp. NJN-50]
MSGRALRCPHCGKEFQISEDAGEKVFCPYCAQPQEPGVPAVSSVPLGGAAHLLPPEAFSAVIQFDRLNASHYAESFESYRRAVLPALQAYLREEAAYGDKAAELFSGALFDGFAGEEKSARKKSVREFDLRISITTLAIPAILDLNTAAADRLADLFLQKWNAVHKEPLGRATYSEIQKGFRKKLCFITTAVCAELGKGDDCGELQALRAFRDGYLSRTPLGRKKIGEYYLFAPLIVSSVESSGKAEAEWNRVYRDYLSPCLAALKCRRPEKCERIYETMMSELEQKWL